MITDESREHNACLILGGDPTGLVRLSARP